MSGEYQHQFLVDAYAQHLARARFGPGVDMGGRHNPLPSERIEARRMVEYAEIYFCQRREPLPYITRRAADGSDRTSCCDTPSLDPWEGEDFRRCSFCRHPLATDPGSGCPDDR